MRTTKADGKREALATMEQWLTSVLIDAAEDSEGEFDPDRPEPIRPGDPVHRAVSAVQRHYGDRLPSQAWQDWNELLLVTRGKTVLTGEQRYLRSVALAESLVAWTRAERKAMNPPKGKRGRPDETPRNEKWLELYESQYPTFTIREFKRELDRTLDEDERVSENALGKALNSVRKRRKSRRKPSPR